MQFRGALFCLDTHCIDSYLLISASGVSTVGGKPLRGYWEPFSDLGISLSGYSPHVTPYFSLVRAQLDSKTIHIN